MGINIHFLDNESYGAEDFRNVFARLTTQGVALYKDNGTLIEDTQEAISSFVSPGVELYNNNACKVVAADGSYKVSEGCLWLSDGTALAVDSDGYELEVESGKVQYVYAENQPIINSAAIVVSDTAGGSDTVPLATIGANGAVTDTRIFATTKVVPCTANVSVVKSAAIDLEADVEDTQYVEIGFSGFSKFLYKGYYNGNSNVARYLDLSDGEYHRLTIKNTGVSSYNGGYVKKSGSGLIFKNFYGSNGYHTDYHAWKETIEFEVV